MTEYYTLMHKGDAEEYTDSMVVNFRNNFTAFISAGNEDTGLVSSSKTVMNACGIIDRTGSGSIEETATAIEEIMPPESDYMFIGIESGVLTAVCRGKVYGVIVRNGEIKRLPNGVIKLDPDDHILCATSAFYSALSMPAILADAMASLSAEEWMDNMVCRISDKTMLAEGNLTALAVISRVEDMTVVQR